MSVVITDWDVGLVRAYLRQDDEKLWPMIDRIPRSYAVDGTGLMLRAAFVEAVHRRFGGKARGDVIRFVAHARIRRGRNAPPIDPGAAEKLIIAALTGTKAEGLTDLQKAQQVILLSELIEDEDLTPDRLEEFLADARTYAQRLAGGL